MATNTTRWNLVVSRKVDIGLRQFLAAQGGGKKGDLSRFVEEAVNKHIFDRAAQAVKLANANVDPEEIEAAIEESLAWARTQKR